MTTTKCMVTPQEAKAKVEKAYQRRFRSWASEIAWNRFAADKTALDFEPKSIGVNLRPPTEAVVLKDSRATRAWAENWRKAADKLPDGAHIAWSTRHWPSVGTQDVPERIDLETAEAIASFSGKARHWRTLAARTRRICDIVGHGHAPEFATDFATDLASAIRKVSSKIAELDESDWAMFQAVFAWLLHNPDTTCYVRELPIPGIHTKWTERNNDLLNPLVTCVVGKTPSFLKPPSQVRVHVLDPAFAPAGMSDFQASPAELSQLDIRPARVLIVENLTTTLALPPITGTWALWGGGFAVTNLADIAWLADVPLFYWGDLDTHGFAILNALRSHVPEARSILMDQKTLMSHLDFCVEEPSPTSAALPHLTADELATYQLLSNDGSATGIIEASCPLAHLRLEQERVGWPYALEVIQHLIG